MRYPRIVQFPWVTGMGMISMPSWVNGSSTACTSSCGLPPPIFRSTSEVLPARRYTFSNSRRGIWTLDGSTFRTMMGIDPERAAEFMQEAGAEFGISLQPGGTGSWQTWMPFFWQAGGEIMGEDGTFTLDGEPCVEALTFYDSFFEEGLTPPAAEDVPVEGRFANGEIAAFISGPWMMSIVEDAGTDPATYAVAHQPTEAAGTSFVGGSNLAFGTAAAYSVLLIGLVLTITLLARWTEGRMARNATAISPAERSPTREFSLSAGRAHGDEGTRSCRR